MNSPRTEDSLKGKISLRQRFSWWEGAFAGSSQNPAINSFLRSCIWTERCTDAPWRISVAHPWKTLHLSKSLPSSCLMMESLEIKSNSTLIRLDETLDQICWKHWLQVPQSFINYFADFLMFPKYIMLSINSSNSKGLFGSWPCQWRLTRQMPFDIWNCMERFIGSNGLYFGAIKTTNLDK